MAKSTAEKDWVYPPSKVINFEVTLGTLGGVDWSVF